jgi:hypothetical protein
MTIRAKKWWRRTTRRARYAPPARRRKPRKNVLDVSQLDALNPGSRLESGASWSFRPDGQDRASEHKSD